MLTGRPDIITERRYIFRHAVAQLLFWSGFYYLFPALLDRIAEQTGWAQIRLSGSLTIGFLVWAVLSPWAGKLIDRGHGGMQMKLAGFAGAALLLALAGTRSEPMAYVCLAMLGIPMAMTLYDPCFALLIRRFGLGARSGNAITMVTLVAGFATLLTFPAVAGLLAAGMGWRWIMAVFALGVTLAVVCLPPEAEVGDRSAIRRDEQATPIGLRLVGLGVAFALLIFAHTVLLFQLPALLSGTLPGETALLLPMILGPAQVVGRLLWSRLAGQIPLGAAVFGLFAALLLPPLLLVAGSGSLTIVFVALVLQGAGYGVQTIVRPVLVARWLPGAIGAKLGTVTMIGLVLMGLGPIAGSAASDLGGYGAVMALATGAVVLAFGFLAAVSRTIENRGWTA